MLLFIVQSTKSPKIYLTFHEVVYLLKSSDSFQSEEAL